MMNMSFDFILRRSSEEVISCSYDRFTGFLPQLKIFFAGEYSQEARWDLFGNDDKLFFRARRR
jgi:hypothetical protein